MNKYDRHIEHLEFSEELVYSSTKVIYNLESEAFKNILTEDLFKEIEKLPP